MKFLNADVKRPLASMSAILDEGNKMGGLDNIETLSGGEDQWQYWSWKIKTAVSGINGDLADMLNAAEADGGRNLEDIKENASRRTESRTACWRRPRDPRRQ